MTYFIENHIAYVCIAITCRIILGLADQKVQLVAFSILASSFPNSREKIFGYASIASGTGLLVGPILGEFMNNKMGGYLPSFLAFAALEVVIGIISAFLLPASLNGEPIISND